MQRVVQLVSLMSMLLFVMLISSCERDQVDVVATIRFLGNPQQSDACGWIVELDQKNKYKPLNLAEEFEEDGLQVRTSFEVGRNTFICDFSNQFREITITEMEAIN